MVSLTKWRVGGERGTDFRQTKGHDSQSEVAAHAEQTGKKLKGGGFTSKQLSN